MSNSIEKGYELAKEMYAKWGVDTDKAMDALDKISISVHCWQGDDVSGFENSGELTGGIQATGNYPGKARNGEELRADMAKMFSLLPGNEYKVNVHAIYAETEGVKVDRDALEPKHFEKWVNWAKENDLGLDFNPSFFSHPLSDDGFTLSSADDAKRAFWVEHGKRSREIGEYFGKELGKTCVNNIWIPDGYKDIPVDRFAPRARLKDSLDKLFANKIDQKLCRDAVESKVFGIGSESYVVGSHEFYMGYAVKNNVALCLDAGHFHPTEVISNKLSSMFNFVDDILLHVSRPVRWDSDHVVILDDELNAIAQEIVRNDFINRTYIALDFFDASINRIAAWAIGSRNTRKALLNALLEPTAKLKQVEAEGDLTSRLALLEEFKTYPMGLVWDYYCLKHNAPVKEAWLGEVKQYEKDVLSKR